MATLSDLYTHLKTLCEQWFYNKSQVDTALSSKISTSSTTGLVKNDGSIDTNTYSTTSHTHGNISSDGKVGSNANYFVTTTTGGAVTSQQKIGNITTDGKIGSTANLPLITTSNGVVTTGSFGTSANSFCEGNDSRLSDARTPTSHNQASSTITDANTYSHIGNSSGTQDSINSAIDTKLGQLQQIKALEMVSTLPTASASTMGVLYVINESNKINFYYTEDNGASANPRYTWHKMDTDILDELVVNWSDVQNKPTSFTPSSHAHGYIKNDGKIDAGGTIADSDENYLVVTNPSRLIGIGKAPANYILDYFAGEYTNIGSSEADDQSTINLLIDTALGERISKSNTGGLVKNDGTIDTTTYLSSLPSHNHGNILNGGTCTTDVTFNSKILVTNSSNQIGTSTAIDVLDSVVQSLISYGTS